MVINGIEMTDRKAVNEHYRVLNERFDHRAAILLSFNFRMEKVEGHDLAVFTTRKFSKKISIAASFVLCADEVVWAERMNDIQY